MNINDLPQSELLPMLRAIKFALDGLWKDEYDLMKDTGYTKETAKEMLEHINHFLTLDIVPKG